MIILIINDYILVQVHLTIKTFKSIQKKELVLKTKQLENVIDEI